MSELLGGLQDRTFARATAATALSYPPERRLSAAQLASSDLIDHLAAIEEAPWGDYRHAGPVKPRTIASRLASHSDLKPFIAGLRPS